MKYNIEEDWALFRDCRYDNFSLTDEISITSQFLNKKAIRLGDAYMMGRLAQKKESQEVIDTLSELSENLLEISKDLYNLLPVGEDKTRIHDKFRDVMLGGLNLPEYAPFKTARKDNVIPIR